MYFFQTAIPSLEFLDNVESIAECSVTDDPMLPKCKDEDEGDRWALFLYETPLYVSENPYLQSLSLSSLTRMGGPDNNGYVVNVSHQIQEPFNLSTYNRLLRYKTTCNFVSMTQLIGKK